MKQIIEKYYGLLIGAGTHLQSPFLLAVRLYWGWQFAQTGWAKLSDLGKVTGFLLNWEYRRPPSTHCLSRVSSLSAVCFS